MFELEKAIKKWRKDLYKNEAFEDGYVEELESHLRDEIERLIDSGTDPKDAFEKAVVMIGSPRSMGAEFYKTHTERLSGRPPWQVPHFMPALIWNCLKVTLRKMRQNKAYSFINIVGLSIGIACCLFILLYVLFELSFDNFHKDVDRIYIVGQDRTSEAGRELVGGNFPLLAPTLKDRYPQVEAAGRFNSGWISQVKYKDKVFKEEALWDADSGILEVLSIPFIQGNPKTALERPNTAVMTEFFTNKYFGDEDPLGKTITIGSKNYEVTGIVQDPPPNTDFAYKIIKSWKTIEMEDKDHWRTWHPGMAATVCLVKLGEGADASDFEEQIQTIPVEFCGEELDKRGLDYKFFLLSLKKRHRVTLSGDQIKPSSSLIYIYIFSAVGLLILLIACMNYMNLATARSANRATEVGMRKVVGAHRRQIVRQFLGESLLIVLVALIFAFALVQVFLPQFNTLALTQFTPQSLFHPGIVIGVILLMLFVGLGAGSYPAFFLSAFKPISVLTGTLKSGSKGAVMRKVLVVGQFVISIALIISTIIIYRQILYMKNQSLGFDKEQKLVITLRSWEMITDKYETVKNEFLQYPAVLNATASSGVPGSMINRTWVFPFGEQDTKGQAFRSLRCDHDFTKVYGLELVAGRPFNKEIQSDTHKAFIINESGVKALGWSTPEEALGKELWDRRYPVIGVVKDYHWWGLQREIEPMIMRVVPNLFRSITLTVNTENMQSTLAFLEKKYAELFPGDLFEYSFVDTNFDIQYRSEERLSRIFQIFTILGIFIACLGLFGLASFIAEQRTKEIGIRRVLGASVSQVLVLLSKEFTKWVLIANLIAWPLAYFAARKWLQNFAYRMILGVEIFIFAAALALIIALCTVGYQAIKAAVANPADSLRYE
ncbi:MAG: ABC transporter permease [Candidatus Aminicenantaceae bacterium]